ncbi:hypothetical protein PMIN06_006992 [Paraphaeosphaeria minitans]|uniref:Uncharacterized protein n=1 Tax=Paraphaeosphaeria minitans TaxID=565426 RepID=A0A9P6GSQ7_9PLEO|nr:hypothetical protein PMIN01_02183 [Paraphaeosphaeria minitans]
MRTSTSSTTLLLAASTLLSAHAQNTTNTTSTPKTCGGDIDWLNTGNSSANSTGQVEFRWTNSSDSEHPASDPWYISVTVNDTLRRGDSRTSASNGGIELRGYVSVPDDVMNASLCLYQFSSANVTLDDSIEDGLDSCGGVVSDECKDLIKDNFLHETQPSGCPLYQKASTDGVDTFKKACPNLVDSASVHYKDVSNTTCAATDIPSVNIPDGYHSVRSASISSPFSDYSYQPNMTETYDLLVRQTVPYILYGRFEDPDSNSGEVMTRFICVAPNRTVEGSRAVPEGKAPWEESKGVGLVAGRMAVVMASIMGVVLII